MIPQLLPISRRPASPAKALHRHDAAQRERQLMRRIAALPLNVEGERVAPDRSLVALAATLLESDVTFTKTFGGECCGPSPQRLLLAVYVAEGQDCELLLTSLCNSAAFDPAPVTLRWALKLLSDGVLELVTGAEGERALRVAPAAQSDLQHWLRRTRNALSFTAGEFAV